ncbi:hypothetical protein GOP47_0028473 [Adiantum capillus-veneris]|nr:hypothetical protein GOP47_0028473 [Adiantum capillus-veneris]
MAGPRTCTLLMVIPLLLFMHAHALTSQEGRPGEFDADAQEIAIEDIENYMTAPIDSDDYFPPGFVSALDTDLTDTLRLHTSLTLHNTGQCFGGGDQNLLEEGLSAQFYYWVERIGGTDDGASTPNTGEASGDSNNDSNRHDELVVIAGGVPQGKRNSSMSSNRESMSTSTTYRTQPPPHRHILHINATKNSTVTKNISRAQFNSTNTKRIISREGTIQDCPPWNNALFTSNYDLNVLTSPNSGYEFPDLIYSPSEEYFLRMQDDCNLVLYHMLEDIGRNKPIWACPNDSCFNKGTQCYARINLDGTFAVYSGSGEPLWWTPTQCSSGSGCWSKTYLIVQDDGNLVLYLQETGQAIWASNTVGQ